MNFDGYETKAAITNGVIDALETGKALRWHNQFMRPRNMTSGHLYHGSNLLRVWRYPAKVQVWATAAKWRELGYEPLIGKGITIRWQIKGRTFRDGSGKIIQEDDKHVYSHVYCPEMVSGNLDLLRSDLKRFTFRRDGKEFHEWVISLPKYGYKVSIQKVAFPNYDAISDTIVVPSGRYDATLLAHAVGWFYQRRVWRRAGH